MLKYRSTGITNPVILTPPSGNSDTKVPKNGPALQTTNILPSYQRSEHQFRSGTGSGDSASPGRYLLGSPLPIFSRAAVAAGCFRLLAALTDLAAARGRAAGRLGGGGATVSGRPPRRRYGGTGNRRFWSRTGWRPHPQPPSLVRSAFFLSEWIMAGLWGMGIVGSRAWLV